jgi:glucose-6-phosphate 1-epimerase
VVSWVAGGRERLFLSPRSRFDGYGAIRGGVPVCFPQFNQRGSLPKHGFVRNLPWQLVQRPAVADDLACLTLRLGDSEATRVHWPQAFEARLTLELRPGQLQMTLLVSNTDAVPLDFTGALHTYLAVEDIARTQLEGLQGQPEWDALRDCHGRAAPVLEFAGEFDRVYEAARSILRLQDGRSGLLVEQSDSWAQTVIWNPGAEKGAALADMPVDGFRHMLCVEAAQVLRPVTVAPGDAWAGWQRLRVA